MREHFRIASLGESLREFDPQATVLAGEVSGERFAHRGRVDQPVDKVGRRYEAHGQDRVPAESNDRAENVW